MKRLLDPAATEPSANPEAAPAPAKPSEVSVVIHRIEVDLSAFGKYLQAHHIALGILIGVATTLLVELVIHFL